MAMARSLCDTNDINSDTAPGRADDPRSTRTAPAGSSRIWFPRGFWFAGIPVRARGCRPTSAGDRAQTAHGLGKFPVNFDVILGHAARGPAAIEGRAHRRPVQLIDALQRRYRLILTG